MIPATDASFQKGQLVPGKSPTRGGIHIVTDVIGATAVLHGATGSVLDKCQTPCSFNDLWPSPYSVEVQKDGYRPARIALQVMAGKVWEQKIGLDEMPSGELSANTEPHHEEKSSPTPAPGHGAIHVVTDVLGATALLHGPVGRVINQCQTPCSFNNLAPARYSLEVQKEGYQPVQTTLQVEQGDAQEQKIRLEPLPRGIFVSSQPPSADVFINGAKQSGQTPLTLPLAPGQYDLVLRLAGYETYAGSIQVKDDIQTQLKVALKKK